MFNINVYLQKKKKLKYLWNQIEEHVPLFSSDCSNCKMFFLANKNHVFFFF